MKGAPTTRAGGVAAIPFAAALVLLVARILPTSFEYRPNDLGIVSMVSRMSYPKHQETFWLIFGVALALLAVWALVRFPLPERAVSRGVAGFEALGFSALLGVLFLPGPAGFVTFALALAGANWLRTRWDSRGSEPTPELAPVTPLVAERRSLVLWGLPAVLLLSLLLTPSVWVHLWNVAKAVPDAELAHDNFKFLAETGQHLAWANSLWHGGLHGRDFFCLYGPFYDFGIVASWSLLGRSVAVTGLYLAAIRITAWLCLFATVALLVRRRWVILLIPFLVPFVKLRVGLALLAFCCLVLWLQSDRRGWIAASGFVTGISLLFSQEYGFAFLLVAALGIAIRRDPRAALLFGAGLVAVVAPTLGIYASAGALGPMLDDVATYPRYVLAGYANLPYPALLSSLPLDPAALATRASAVIRLAYAVPLVCVAGIALSLRVGRIDWRRPLASSREIVRGLGRDPERLAVLLMALFALISFRSALGRSDPSHLQAAMPGAVVLVCVAADRTLGLWFAGRWLRPLAIARTALLAAFVLLGGFPQMTAPITAAAESVRTAVDLVRFGHKPRGSRRVLRIVRWVQLNTAPGEPVLFLPNDAAYYFLTDRPSPIRFVLGHQIVGDDHRSEVLADLRAEPPRYVVWDHDALVVDDIPHEVVFGDEITRFLDESYELETSLGRFDILRRVGAPRGR
jgi:hypothetical protein